MFEKEIVKNQFQYLIEKKYLEFQKKSWKVRILKKKI